MPTLKYKDPVTGEYKSDIHVVGAVSSVNGKTGVVEIDNSDITEALGYTPADDQTAMEYYILTYDGSHFFHDGQQLTFTEIKNKCLDEKHFVYCQYNGDLYIPQHVLGAQIFFDATYIRNGNVEIHRISITPAGTATETVTTQEKLIAGSGVTIAEDGKTISAVVPIKGVSVGGTALTPDTAGNVALPNAGQQKLGVVRYTDSSTGLVINSQGYITLAGATDAQIAVRNNNPRPITIQNLDYAVKAAMCDGHGAAWTTEEQAVARTRLGMDGATQLLDMTTSETGSVDVSFEKCYRSVSVIIRIPANTTWGTSDAVIYSDYSTRYIGAGEISSLTSAASNETMTKVMAYVQDGFWRSTFMASTRSRWGNMREQALGMFMYSTENYPYVNRFKCGVVPAGTKIIVYGY